MTIMILDEETLEEYGFGQPETLKETIIRGNHDDAPPNASPPSGRGKSSGNHSHIPWRQKSREQILESLMSQYLDQQALDTRTLHFKMDKVDGILSGMIDELSLSFRRMKIKLTKDVATLTKKNTVLEERLKMLEERANKNEEKLHEEIFLLRELADCQREAGKNHMSDFKVLFSNDLSSAAQIKKYEDKAKATMVKIKNLEDSYKLLTETIHVEFDKSLNLLHGIKSKLGSTETTFNETIERLDKKYNSLLLRATICEKRIKENS
ncbi:hypothetical protein AtNW77_Chr2g0231701 [Arabidopsis thaliana]